MKKALFVVLTVFLAGCGYNNGQGFTIKKVNLGRSLQDSSCGYQQQNRQVQIDGVDGYYDYSDFNACAVPATEEAQPYQNPQRHRIHRREIRPLGKMN